MYTRFLDKLRHPATGQTLEVESISSGDREQVQEGALVASIGRHRVEIKRSIPRFCDSGYTGSFGQQWRRHRRTQLDSFNGTTLSRDRLFGDTGWSPEELKGKRVLEAGCGAGRFTEVLLETGAEVYAVDSSESVDSVRESSSHPDLCLAQADLFALPFPKGFFDRVLCFGVLQHTPDPRRAFRALLQFLKPGGLISADVYQRKSPRRLDRYAAKYWWRPITKRLPVDLLYRIVQWYVPRWLPIDSRLKGVRRVGRYLVSVIPCWNYEGVLPLSREQIVDWAILDTFDALSPRYDQPQRIETVRGWLKEAGLDADGVRPGQNGLVINAQVPVEGLGTPSVT